MESEHWFRGLQPNDLSYQGVTIGEGKRTEHKIRRPLTFQTSPKQPHLVASVWATSPCA